MVCHFWPLYKFGRPSQAAGYLMIWRKSVFSWRAFYLKGTLFLTFHICLFTVLKYDHHWSSSLINGIAGKGTEWTMSRGPKAPGTPNQDQKTLGVFGPAMMLDPLCSALSFDAGQGPQGLIYLCGALGTNWCGDPLDYKSPQDNSGPGHGKRAKVSVSFIPPLKMNSIDLNMYLAYETKISAWSPQTSQK